MPNEWPGVSVYKTIANTPLLMAFACQAAGFRAAFTSQTARTYSELPEHAKPKIDDLKLEVQSIN